MCPDGELRGRSPDSVRGGVCEVEMADVAPGRSPGYGGCRDCRRGRPSRNRMPMLKRNPACL